MVDQAAVMGKGFTANELEGEKKVSCGDTVLVRIYCGSTFLLKLCSVLVKIVT